MRSTRSRAPESTPMRHGPEGRRRTTNAGFIGLLGEPAGQGVGSGETLQRSQVGAGDQLRFFRSSGVEAAATPRELEIGEADAATAARASAAERVVLEQAERLHQLPGEGLVLLAQN